MQRFLIGGGWSPAAQEQIYRPFLDAAGHDPTIACVVLDEGDGIEQFLRWDTALRAVASCRPVPVLVAEGGMLDVTTLPAADGLLVCGGLTPAYAEALAPAATGLTQWLGARPYAGFSAGAAIAATRAVVGGWLQGGVPVCPEDSAEDLAEVTVLDGLGLVEFAVEVHAAQWGNLGRLISAVQAGQVRAGVALDEDTLLVVSDDGTLSVGGLGQVHVVRRNGPGAIVQSYGPGSTPDPAQLSADEAGDATAPHGYR